MGTCESNKKKENIEYINLGICNKSSNLRKRERINSDPQINSPSLEKLQPMRRHSRYYNEIPEDDTSSSGCGNNNYNKNNSINNNNNNKTRIIELNKRNSVISQRKSSIEYCTEFRNNYMSSGQNGLLRHLTESVRRIQEYSEEELEELKKKVIPEYIIDWRLIKDPITKTTYWKNNGKIPIDDEEVKKILFPKSNYNYKKAIGASEPFYKKRLWLCQYIFKNFKSQTNENPILVINRQNILEDSYQQFMTTKGFNIRRPIRIYFIDEVASDAGGVYRDWYSCLFKSIFSKEKKLFRKNPNNAIGGESYLLYPKYKGMKINYYEFFGRLVTKALVDMMNIENIVLNRIIFKVLMKRPINLDDLRYYDLSLYQSLKYIQETDVDKNEEFKEFKFVWTIRDENNNKSEVELVPGWGNVSLNENNKLLFIDKVIYQETIKPYEEQINYIKKGVETLMGDEIRGVFSIEELNFLISGQPQIEINDWQENTVYKGEYNQNHPTIKIFWEVIKSLTHPQLSKFLEFSTGSSSVPMDGFASLKGTGGMIQKFTIEPYSNFSAIDPCEYEFRLIEAKTCFNRILLPKYKNKYEMEKALTIILNNDTSFFGLE